MEDRRDHSPFEKVVAYSESTTVMSDSSSLVDSSVTQSTTVRRLYGNSYTDTCSFAF